MMPAWEDKEVQAWMGAQQPDMNLAPQMLATPVAVPAPQTNVKNAIPERNLRNQKQGAT